MARRGAARPQRKKKRRQRKKVLDDFTKKEVLAATPYLSFIFSKYAFLGVFVGVFVIAFTVGEIVLVPYFTLYFRAVGALRTLLLLCIALRARLVRDYQIVYMSGNGNSAKHIRALRRAPLLWLWYALSSLDLWLARLPPIFLDAYSIWNPVPGQLPAAGMLRVALDLVVAFELLWTRNIVITQGLRRNVIYNFVNGV